MEAIYGDDVDLIKSKLARIAAIKKHPLIHNRKHSLARAPGRISFSKHCDYVNNDLMYFTDDRDTFVAVSSQPGTGEINIDNLDDKYPAYSCKNLDITIEKNSWLSYPIALLKILRNNYNISLEKLDINILVSSEIPAAGGLSSSHALLLAMIIAIASELNCEPLIQAYRDKSATILKLLQQVENARGFNSGLGDPAAQMLAKRGEFVLVKLEPELRYSYLKLPDKLAVITAPSFIAADKSLPEFAEANANIAAYKTLNELAEKIFKTKYLGDAIDNHSEDELRSAIQNIGDDRLRGLAIYALSEGLRLREIKTYSGNLLTKLGEHLNLSHAGEKLSNRQNQLIPGLDLKQHSGLYGASTKANDELQAFATSLEGVYGSSISGAGLGGNNIILTTKDKANLIKEQLIENYYSPKGLEKEAEEQVHISKSSAAACLIS